MSDKKAYKVVDKHNFQTDYVLTQKALDELLRFIPTYPISHIKSLLGKIFSTQTKLREAIQQEIADNATGNKTERQAVAKKWVVKKYKEIIFEHCTKKINPSLLFISIGTDNLDDYLEKAFDKAKTLLLTPEKLPLKEI